MRVSVHPPRSDTNACSSFSANKTIQQYTFQLMKKCFNKVKSTELKISCLCKDCKLPFLPSHSCFSSTHFKIITGISLPPFFGTSNHFYLKKCQYLVQQVSSGTFHPMSVQLPLSFYPLFDPISPLSLSIFICKKARKANFRASSGAAS